MTDSAQTATIATPSVEDRALVQDTLARMNRAFDTEDIDALQDVFTETGAWVSPLYGAIEGRAARAEFFAKFFTDDSQLAYRKGQHWISNLIFDEVGPERIVTWSNFALFNGGDAGPHAVFLGHYVDTFHKVDGRWLFERREITATMS